MSRRAGWLLAIGLLVSGANGLNDLDSAVDAAAAAVIAAFVAACWAGTIDLLRAGPRRPEPATGEAAP
ncbi:MAG: hypothetical protein ACRDZ7_10675 [Acidimicrobiia bacterium]